jgi:transposase
MPCVREILRLKAEGLSDRAIARSTVSDYAGQTVELIDGRTWEICAAQVFVAVLGRRATTYAEATFTQTLPH